MRRRFFPMARRGGAHPPRAFGTGSRRPRPCPNPRWPTAPGVTARNATRPAAVAPAPGGAQRDGAAGGGTGGGGGARGAPRPRGRRPGRRRWLTAGVGAGFRPAAAHGGAGIGIRGLDRRPGRAAAGEGGAAAAPPRCHHRAATAPTQCRSRARGPGLPAGGVAATAWARPTAARGRGRPPPRGGPGGRAWRVWTCVVISPGTGGSAEPPSHEPAVLRLLGAERIAHRCPGPLREGASAAGKYRPQPPSDIRLVHWAYSALAIHFHLRAMPPGGPRRQAPRRGMTTAAPPAGFPRPAVRGRTRPA
ncbi:hypothetical protein HNR12_001996 [Streptomonospora nanhaiensis]|uniref:Uncharacterized protein n=1 Tax=Streptomonospora nanhaiensis TaxID=1323731 RepID=A0A853BJQ9_9ACTN|nr:hypothetical protein [Streptomonospora nanhaiensis]